MEAAATGELRARGEITIPKKIRELFQLESGDSVEFIPLGNKVLLLAPKPLPLEEARQEIRKILKRSGSSPEDLLKGLAPVGLNDREHFESTPRVIFFEHPGNGIEMRMLPGKKDKK